MLTDENGRCYAKDVEYIHIFLTQLELSHSVVMYRGTCTLCTLPVRHLKHDPYSLPYRTL